ncbi:MAG: hypothetical protein H7X93_00855, partial [Sphingomonadaceae bacterium]|nr:hypothetical protein [Sphingomonadaceae bacterium]
MASEDTPANLHGGPATPQGNAGISPEDKVALRRGLRAARRDFVATLDEDARARAFDPAGGAIGALIGRARTVAVYVA